MATKTGRLDDNWDDLGICNDCAKHPSLKRMVEKLAAAGRACSLCGSTKVVVKVLDASIINLMKALVRYYYSELEYNTHYGGDPITELFIKENPIISHANIDACERIGEIVFADCHPRPDTGITMFVEFHHALKDSTSDVVSELRKRLLIENHFDLEDKPRKVLGRLRIKIAQKIAFGTRLCRARVGFARKFNDESVFDFTPKVVYVPYNGSDISAPPSALATAGRANRAATAFLYLATDAETALAEVRPHPGQHVSLGWFKVSRDLILADLSGAKIEDYAFNDNTLEDFLFLKSLDDEFSTPITPDERSKYVVGQLIADILRQLGFDGVGYRSSVGTGHNVCLFRSDSCTYTPDNAAVLKVTSLAYTTTSLQSVVSPLKK